MYEDLQETLYTLEQYHDDQGRLLVEIFRDQAGYLDRGGMPSFIVYDAETGNVELMHYHKKGKMHRDGDEPAHVHFDPEHQVIIGKQWFKNGDKHRDNGKPASIAFNLQGEIRYRGFHERNQIVRNPIRGVERNKEWTIDVGEPE